jgi:hypothetical protein
MSSRFSFPTIPLDVAEEGTDNWRDFYQFSTKTLDTRQIFRGFHIPVADLKTLLEEAGDIDGVRAYFALEAPFDPLTPEAEKDIHIYLVPVKDNVDICQDPETGESNVCDFTTPCPKICDTSSPLYTLPTDDTTNG